MEFQVPQFIEIEDKIFGPLTLKQFIYLAGGAGLSFFFFTIFPFFVAIFFMIPAIVLSLALAFYKVNSRDFIFILEVAFNYLKNSKLYIWKKIPKKIKKKKDELISDPFLQTQIPKLSDSKLSDLSWSLDIKDNIIDEMNNN